MTVTRDQLYGQVWARPMLAVANDYEVSANYLARVCASLNVPWPPRGYWAKVAAGHKPPQPALPPARPGDQLEWEKGAGLDLVLPRPPRKPREAAQPADTPEPNKPPLPDRHALIRGAREHFEIDRFTEHGYLRPRKRLLVDIVVSKAMLSTALDVANHLFLMLERHGHRVALAPGNRYGNRPAVELEGKKYDYYNTEPWRPDRPTVVFVKDVAFGLTLFESSSPVEVQKVNGAWIPVAQLTPAHLRWMQRNYTWKTTEHLPTGRLTLRAFAAERSVTWQQEWAEKKLGELPHRFHTIRRTLVKAVPAIGVLMEKARLEAEVRRREAEIQHAKWEREERERREKEAYKESRDQLLAIVDRWALARRIEDFFQDLERRSANLEETERAALSVRLQEAREMLGTLDATRHFSTWRPPSERLQAKGA